MTGPQLPATLGYLAILGLALLAPYLPRKWATGAADRWLIGAVLGCAIVLTAARQGAFQILSVVLLLPLLGLGARALLGGVAAILLFAPAIWWAPQTQLGLSGSALFVTLALAAGFLPRLRWKVAVEPASLRLALPLIAALLAGIAVGLFTAPLAAREPMYFAWHHWGAYLSPAEAWRAGGLPYRDFPIQYGLGPTAILTVACGSADCWTGMFATAVAANALYFAALTGCVIVLTSGRARGIRWLAIVALWCACFVWTAFPANLGSTAMTPSVAGLRFLPIAVLLLHVLVAEARERRSDWIGHVTWLCALVWSPEAAFFATLIWWPNLALRRAADAETPGSAWVELARGAARGAAALAAGLIGLAALLLLLSGGAARADDFLAYVMHPPGPLPMNPLGMIWLALACVMVALQQLVGERRSRSGRMLYAVLLGALAAGTYYLSRSHDNNILNLFPLLVVLITASLARPSDSEQTVAFRDGFGRTVLAAMVAFTAMAGGSAWAEGARRDGTFSIGPGRLIARFTPGEVSGPEILPPDAVRALAALRARHAGAVVLIDENRLIPGHAGAPVWSGVNNAANFEPLPPGTIRRYVCRGALAYRRAGWVLIQQPRYASWITPFLAAYDVRQQLEFGTYRAFYLVPRAGNLPCAEL